MELDLVAIHEALAAQLGDRPCLIWRGRTWSWSEVTDRTRRVAAVLADQGIGRRGSLADCEGWESPHDHVGLYLQNGKLHHTYSLVGLEVTTLTSTEAVPAGKVQVKYEFTAENPGKMGTGGKGRLFIDGKAVGENKLAATVPARFTSYSGFDIGKDNGDVVSESYKDKAPFAFTGKIEKVVFDLAPAGVGARERRRLLEERFADAVRN